MINGNQLGGADQKETAVVVSGATAAPCRLYRFDPDTMIHAHNACHALVNNGLQYAFPVYALWCVGKRLNIPTAAVPRSCRKQRQPEWLSPHNAPSAGADCASSYTDRYPGTRCSKERAGDGNTETDNSTLSGHGRQASARQAPKAAGKFVGLCRKSRLGTARCPGGLVNHMRAPGSGIFLGPRLASWDPRNDSYR